ncbi:MAG: 2-hydroxyacid dehydrogenase [Oscillospiraceae bacterium]|nr:2-hydroxyacid dehydrogenase [Oscillospiraceae bacterium]
MEHNVVLYCEKVPEGAAALIEELCPPELELRFLYPVGNTKPGDFEDADFILSSIRRIGREEIDRAKSLKLIHSPTAGFNHVDLEYARSKGIPVCNSAGENASTTAEFTIALMLACMRRLSMIDRRCKQGEWHTWTWRHDQYELRGKTIGVVGGGAIGRMVLQRLQGWDCARFLYCDPFPMPKELEEALRCERVDLETLLRESDVVSLHCPLTEQTRGLIGEAQFALMKPNAIIVNEARGAVIDEAALVRALQEERIWGAAIDTWEREPLDPNDPLIQMEKCITTSHLGAATRESVIRCFSVGYENILRCMRGEPLVNVVNG